MPYSLAAPPNSFVQFAVSDQIQSCEFPDIELCLPVYEDNDVSFQFIVTADSEEEADALCDLTNTKVAIGITSDCAEGFLLQFSEKPERYRIGLKKVLYNWGHGLPDFATVISRRECFHIKIIINSLYSFCSNCFQRITETCHTSVIEYSNEDDYAGFNYCNSASGDDESIPGGQCFDPTIIQFTNVPTLTIPYTAALQLKYGNSPSVSAWLYDADSILTNMGVRISFDAYPPTVIRVDLGGNASGILVVR